ncbi:MAG TPA: hypothetical protein VFS97_10595 [Nitrososphaeraceae archaeon]|nr:hypothetical protein [Nitrososphaeraceae archaeon]
MNVDYFGKTPTEDCMKLRDIITIGTAGSYGQSADTGERTKESMRLHC